MGCGGGGSVARVNEFFTKNPNLKKKKIEGVGARMAWVSEFFTKNPNLKKRRKYIFFSVFGGGCW